MGDEDDEDEDETVCPAGAFASNGQVTEMCPEAFLKNGKVDWTVLFYLPGRSHDNYLTMWRALGDMVSAHNKRAQVGAVDCGKFANFCKSKGAGKRDLPLVLRYAAGSSVGKPRKTKGNPVLEDWVKFAAGATEL